jgi:hypothetical protein
MPGRYAFLSACHVILRFADGFGQFEPLASIAAMAEASVQPEP